MTSLVSCALEAELPVPFTDKRAMRDTHSVGQKKQQKAKKGSDADSDVFSEGDGYMDSGAVTLDLSPKAPLGKLSLAL